MAKDRDPKGKKWYCYVCAKAIKGIFFLVSMRKETDRVFLVCSDKCIKGFLVVPRNEVWVKKVKKGRPKFDKDGFTIII